MLSVGIISSSWPNGKNTFVVRVEIVYGSRPRRNWSPGCSAAVTELQYRNPALSSFRSNRELGIVSFKLDVLAISRQPAAEVHAHDLFRADFDLFLQKRRPYMCKLFSCTSSTNRPEVIRLSSMNVKQNVPCSDTRLDGWFVLCRS